MERKHGFPVDLPVNQSTDVQHLQITSNNSKLINLLVPWGKHTKKCENPWVSHSEHGLYESTNHPHLSAGASPVQRSGGPGRRAPGWIRWREKLWVWMGKKKLFPWENYGKIMSSPIKMFPSTNPNDSRGLLLCTTILTQKTQVEKVTRNVIRSFPRGNPWISIVNHRIWECCVTIRISHWIPIKSPCSEMNPLTWSDWKWDIPQKNHQPIPILIVWPSGYLT